MKKWFSVVLALLTMLFSGVAQAQERVTSFRLQAGEGLTQGMKRSGMDINWLYQVMYENQIPTLKLRYLPIGLEVKISFDYTQAVPEHIRRYSQEAMFTDVDHAKLVKAQAELAQLKEEKQVHGDPAMKANLEKATAKIAELEKSVSAYQKKLEVVEQENQALKQAAVAARQEKAQAEAPVQNPDPRVSALDQALAGERRQTAALKEQLKTALAKAERQEAQASQRGQYFPWSWPAIASYLFFLAVGAVLVWVFIGHRVGAVREQIEATFREQIQEAERAAASASNDAHNARCALARAMRERDELVLAHGPLLQELAGLRATNAEQAARLQKVEAAVATTVSADRMIEITAGGQTYPFHFKAMEQLPGASGGIPVLLITYKCQLCPTPCYVRQFPDGNEDRQDLHDHARGHASRQEIIVPEAVAALAASVASSPVH